jgi:dihydrofolate reductase
LRQAREVAGNKDIRISGGADAVRQYLDAGHLDESRIDVAPGSFSAEAYVYSKASTGARFRSISSTRFIHRW